MPAHLEPYSPALWSLTALVLLILLQQLVADLARIKAGATPGSPLPVDHDRFSFRAERAHANTVENLSVFALAALLALVTGVDATAVNVGTVAFVASRAAHMVLYYLDVRALRSVAFGAGVLATAGLAGAIALHLA